MLNKEQLSILNDIFHSAIKPAFEENEEALETFMKKVEEHENWVSMVSSLDSSEAIVLPAINTSNFAD